MTIISTLRTIREIIEELTKIYDGLKRLLVEIIVLILIATGKIPLELLIVVVLMHTLPHLAAPLTIKPPSGGF